jgi:hypothetical protein
MTNSDNGWRGRTDARLDETERRIGIVEHHPATCPQIDIVKDHEKRLRTLEGWRWQVVGAVIAVQAIGSAVIIETIRNMLK